MIILGADGQLGTAMKQVFPDGRFAGRAEIDLTDLPPTVNALEQIEPGAIVNCAAYDAVDRAEEEEDNAYAVNAEAVRALAAFAASQSIPFVTYSTDYVFDGLGRDPYLESASPHPINAYGRTKLAGERLALGEHPSGTLVIRTSWVISGTHRNFVSVILEKAQQGSFSVVDDQIGRPTVAADLAEASACALEAGLTGLLHLTNGGSPVSWYGLTAEILRLADMNTELVTPCSSEQYPTKATRPKFSVLATERVGEPGVTPLPDWKESLPTVVARALERVGR